MRSDMPDQIMARIKNARMRTENENAKERTRLDR